MDRQDRQILNILQKDGRCSYAEIGRSVGLSITAVKDRVDKLQNKSILKNFSASIDEKSAGYGIIAFVLVGIDKSEDCAVFEEKVSGVPTIQECHHVTGAFNYILKVLALDMGDLEAQLTNHIKVEGIVSRTETTIVFSSVKNQSFVDCMRLGD